ISLGSAPTAAGSWWRWTATSITLLRRHAFGTGPGRTRSLPGAACGPCITPAAIYGGPRTWSRKFAGSSTHRPWRHEPRRARRAKSCLGFLAITERCVVRPAASRPLPYAAESRILPRNSAFDVRGAARLSVRGREARGGAGKPRNLAFGARERSFGVGGAAQLSLRGPVGHRRTTQAAQPSARAHSGTEVPRHEVELQAHLAHLFVVDHRGMPGVINVQLHLAAPAPQRRHIILDLPQRAARIVRP